MQRLPRQPAGSLILLLDAPREGQPCVVPVARRTVVVHEQCLCQAPCRDHV